jgi:hypothetical protein
MKSIVNRDKVWSINGFLNADFLYIERSISERREFLRVVVDNFANARLPTLAEIRGARLTRLSEKEVLFSTDQRLLKCL